jgi:hypothetical protein
MLTLRISIITNISIQNNEGIVMMKAATLVLYPKEAIWLTKKGLKYRYPIVIVMILRIVTTGLMAVKAFPIGSLFFFWKA